MPIQHDPGACTTYTGDAIQLYRLVAMKHALILEGKGIRFNGRTRLVLAREQLDVMHLRTRAAVIAHIQSILDTRGHALSTNPIQPTVGHAS